MTLETSQRRGCILLILILVSLYCGRDSLMNFLADGKGPHLYADSNRGTIAVELAGDTERRGIYFIPPRTTVRRFLEMTGESNVSITVTDPDLILINGTAVIVQGEGVSRTVPAPGVIGNAGRMVLGMPMELNKATVEELAMVEGIGLKTAGWIVEKRDEKGGFGKIEELLEVRGIGEKKFRTFRKYIFIAPRR